MILKSGSTLFFLFFSKVLVRQTSAKRCNFSWCLPLCLKQSPAVTRYNLSRSSELRYQKLSFCIEGNFVSAGTARAVQDPLYMLNLKICSAAVAHMCIHTHTRTHTHTYTLFSFYSHYLCGYAQAFMMGLYSAHSNKQHT